jgi:GAF domain-containing protein
VVFSGLVAVPDSWQTTPEALCQCNRESLGEEPADPQAGHTIFTSHITGIVVVQRIVDSLRTLIGVKNSVLYRLEPESGDLVTLVASGNVMPVFDRNLRFPRGTGMVGLAVQERCPMTTPNVLTDPHIMFTPEARARMAQAEYGAVLAVPLLIQDQVIGALGIGDRTGRMFHAEEIRLVQAFADQAALALHNAQLYETLAIRATRLQSLTRLNQLISSSLVP